MLTLHTSLGDIGLELDAEKAPATVENFLTYAKDGFFDGTIFHRVIENFMIQGGGMIADKSQKTTRAAIKNEADNGLKNTAGTIAMARTNDPHSATAQFFINVSDNEFLNHRYAVFGKVVSGMEVVEKITAVKTGRRGSHDDVPEETVTIERVTIS